MGRLRNSARVFGLSWSDGVPLDAFIRSLPHDEPRTSAFLVAVRRAAGGAGYAPYVDGEVPWHAAVAATYAQATAPLRRLQDRYVIETVLAAANDRPVPPEIDEALGRLPAAMAQGEQRANRAEREALELAEAVVLSGREGHTFQAVVVDEGERGVEFQIADPAVLAWVRAHHVDPGDDITVRLVSVDVAGRETQFERVA
jgi:exoribonuclease R